MNREIKFRGKDLIHNEWIYGGLTEDKDENAVILPKNNWQKGGCVDKDTIGQFTGIYAPNSWRGLPDGMQRYKAALLRHLVSFENGEEFDKESQLPALAHMVWNAIAMLAIWHDKCKRNG